MATLLSTALSAVRSLIDEPNAAFWTNTELKRWINEGCKDVARRAETKQTTHTITVTAGTQNFTAPTDCYRIHRVNFIQTPTSTSPNTYTLEFRGVMEMDQIWGINQNWPATYPLYYCTWTHPPNIKIITFPVTATPGKLKIWYYQQIVTATTTSSPIDILPGWEDMVYDYAAYRALRKDNNQMWKTHQQIYEAKLTEMIDKTRTFQDQPNYFTTGQQALPTWLISNTIS